eukprot:2452410-Prymnesium_polylepis.1
MPPPVVAPTHAATRACPPIPHVMPTHAQHVHATCAHAHATCHMPHAHAHAHAHAAHPHATCHMPHARAVRARAVWWQAGVCVCRLLKLPDVLLADDEDVAALTDGSELELLPG